MLKNGAAGMPPGMPGMQAPADGGKYAPSSASRWAAALDGDDGDGAATARMAQRKRRRLGRFAEAASRLDGDAPLERALGPAWFAMRGFDVHLLAVGGPMRK